MQPRTYQFAAIEQTLIAFKGARKVLGVLPTGGGKTLIFSWLAQRLLPKRSLIIAHRDELLDQAIEKLYRATGIYAQKEKAECRASLSAQIVVGSVQTMMRRLHKWPAEHFGLVIVDEAHHALADSYQSLLRHFSQSWVLGLTATPDRGDRKNLGQYFEAIAFDLSLFDLIKQGFLSPIVIRSVPLKIDIRRVGQSAGDYNESELGQALTPYLRLIAQSVKEYASFRKTLVFLPLIATSKEFVEICKSEGINACHIDGTSEDRKEILKAFRAGEYDLLANAMLLTEGYDEPSVDCVIVLRPTRSRALYAQMVGRGTRIAEAKENLLLMDFLWLHEKHRLIHPSHLIAGNEEESEIITRLTESAGGERELSDLSDRAKAEREEKLRRELEAKRKKNARYIDAGELSLFVHQPDLVNYEPTFNWENAPVSEGQWRALENWGIDVSTVNNKGHASKIIDILMNRADAKLSTPKQIRLMRRFGYQTPEGATREEASEFLSRRFEVTGRK